jgi:hypothetical protein
MKHPTGDEQTPAGRPYHSWDDFLTNGFPQFTGGLSARTGYATLMLAKSQALRKLPEPELRKFENLSNAFQLVKLERKGVVISEELIAAAQTLPVESFRQITGSDKRAVVEVQVDDSDTARRLQWILNFLRMADPDSLLAFQEVLQNALLQSSGNATDALDCTIAACIHQWRQEGILELPASRKLPQKDRPSY